MPKDKIKVDPSEVKTRKKVSGYGLLGTKYKKNPKYRDKPRNKRVDIREMNEAAQDLDPFDQAIRQIEKEFNINLAEGRCGGSENEEEFDAHGLSDNQMRSLVDFVHDELLGGQPVTDHRVLEDAIHQALDDVPGFETGDRDNVVGRMVSLYNQMYGRK